MYNTLKHFKQSGTRNLDGPDTKILKLAAPLIADTLTYLYNLCIMKNTFPCAFKKSKVISLYKSGNSADPSNYRPISIVSVLSKPLEKHINNHLLLELNGGIFVDFKKAFDVIDHDLLLRKLSFHGMSDTALELFQSYLTNRHQCITFGTKTSSLSTFKFCAPQGSVLGPILFSLYINDLPLYRETLCERFADYTSLHSHHTN